MNDWLLPLTLASSLLAGLVIFFLPCLLYTSDAADE